MFGSERNRTLQLILDSTPDSTTVQRPDGNLEGQGAGGVGLVGLRERFELLGGALEIESNPGSGTRIVGMFIWRLLAEAASIG